MVEPVQKMPASMPTRLKQLEKEVTELRNQLVQFSNAVNNAFKEQVGGVAKRVEDLEEIVSVMVDDFGIEALEAGLEARRARKVAEGIQKAKDNIAAGLQQGYLVAATEISPDSLIVGTETAPDGSVVAEFASMLFRQMKPEAQEGLLGKGVGTTYQAGPNVFTVNEIYNVNVTAALEAAKAAPEAA